MNKQWSFAQKSFISGPKVSDLDHFLALLADRSKQNGNFDEDEYFRPQIAHLGSPYGMAGMTQAIEIIESHIKAQDRIMIYGDFDTDGITSTVTLAQGLKDLGAQVSYRIPDRVKHSHGLNTELIDEIKATGTQLIITCDCGINDQAEVTYAQSLGLKVIITDHHAPNPTQSTSAEAVINPLQKHCTYPQKNLSGSAIAFKVVHAIAQKKLEPQDLNNFLEKYLEVAAIGIIGDCVPLQGENRTLAALGLKALSQSQWPGLAEALKQETMIDEQTISFNLAPKLNAASRLGDVQHGVDLFMGKNPESQHQYLVSLNQQRKFRTHEIATEALAQIQISAAGIAFIYQADWDTGILGLVASKISEKFGTPSFVGSRKENGNWGFSVRSAGNFSVIKALLSAEDIFEKVGGHDGAAGFEIKENNLSLLREKLDLYAHENPVNAPAIESLAVLDETILEIDLFEAMQNFKPFGVGNSEPIFEIKSAQIRELKIIGKEANHLKMIIDKSGKRFEVLAFFKADAKALLSTLPTIDLFFTLSVNEFRGNKTLQLRLIDFNY